MAGRLRQCQVSLSFPSQCLPATCRQWRPSRCLTTPSRRFLSLPVQPEEVEFEHGELYNYTSRRFLINEKDKLAKRKVKFDVNALGAVAANCANAKGAVAVNIDKVLEGECSKTYLIDLNDGSKWMAKLPITEAGTLKATTFCETTTLKLMNRIVDVPVLRAKVAADLAEETDVGSPFILTAAPRGVPLGSVWHQMDSTSQHEAMRAVISYVKRWSDFKYPGFGGICEKDVAEIVGNSVPFSMEQPTFKAARRAYDLQSRSFSSNKALERRQNYLSGLVIGPVPAKVKEMSPRGQLFSHQATGPWNSSKDYLKSVTAMAELKDLPQSSRAHLSGSFGRFPDSRMKAVRLYQAILPYITPQAKSLLLPSLWKPNITADTVYVDPNSPTKIVSLADWQNAEVVPKYRQLNQPPFLTSDGSVDSAPSTETVYDVYVRLEPKPMKYILQAMQFKKMPEHQLPESAHDIVGDDGISFLSCAIEYIQNERPDITELLEDDPELSIPKLSRDFEQQITLHRRKEEIMQKVQREFGGLVAEDWTVKPADYDKIKMMLASLKERMNEHAPTNEAAQKEWDELWPFDD